MTASFQVGNDFAVLCANDQTITGIKTFSTAPIIASITNGASIINMPSSSGTIALTSQVPTFPSTTVTDNVCSFTNTIGGLKDSGISANNIVTLNGTQTINNKTINVLTAIGTSQSTLAGKKTKSYFTGVSTSGATSSTIATIAVPNNSLLVTKVKSLARCTASTGLNLNKIAMTEYFVGCKNIAGTLTTYVISSASNADLLFLPTITSSTSSTNLVISCNGTLGDTISYAGSYSVSYQ